MKPKSIRVCPKVGRGKHRFLQTGLRKAAHIRAAKRGEKLPPLSNNQVEELPKLPFPHLMADKAVFAISPDYKSRFATRFRRRVIVNRDTTV